MEPLQFMIDGYRRCALASNSLTRKYLRENDFLVIDRPILFVEKAEVADLLSFINDHQLKQPSHYFFQQLAKMTVYSFRADGYEGKLRGTTENDPFYAQTQALLSKKDHETVAFVSQETLVTLISATMQQIRAEKEKPQQQDMPEYLYVV